ncbi:TIGR03759 family integrating conjugative element protein [Carnimonas bestiolae]|uniref:TIGR03759 family integrating conjugative element protein n=1 Tax=Carnimonas bestiolae TaxID=3402172 RepID=UPI003EDC130E
MRLHIYLLTLGMVVTCHPVMAQQASHSAETTSTMTESATQQSAQRGAKAWGLSEQDYQRYQSIMEGPRGKWSPDIDPITALGLNAKSDAERAKYAEMAVKAERERVTQELAFQRAYDDAWKRMYPDALRVNPFSVNGGQQNNSAFSGSSGTSNASSVFNTSNRSNRLNVVIATSGCSTCDSTVKQLLERNAAMDVWVTDANGDDGKIRSWAASVGIPPERVSSGRVTLNHAGKSLQIDASKLPRVAPRS